MGKKSGKDQGSKAARIQGEAEERIATGGTYADRPDQFNPWGSLTYETYEDIDPATGETVTRWRQNQNLSPEMQRLYDMSMEQMLAGSQARSGLLNRAYQDLQETPDWAQFGDVDQLSFTPDEARQRAEDMAYQRDVMRLDPQFNQEQSRLEAQLANQGLTPGDRAYDSAMNSFYQNRNDAYERARLGSAAAGRQEVEGMWGREVDRNSIANALRDQQIQEYIGQRRFGLDEAAMLQGNDFATAVDAVGGA